jgi:hypothetical protein
MFKKVVDEILAVFRRFHILGIYDKNILKRKEKRKDL